VSPFLEVPPSEWIASNELAFAIPDRHPVSRGHALVVTHRVVEHWWECTPPERAALMSLVDEVRDRLVDKYRPAGFNVGFNSGAAAGQTVPHVHVHVIPRYDGDLPDPRGGVRHVIPHLGNYLAPSAPVTPPTLVTPMGGRMRLELLRCLIREDLDRIDLVVSFVMRSGLDLIAARLDDALARGAKVRVLTTDYLGITDDSALGFLLDRSEAIDRNGNATMLATNRLSVRVFSDPSTSFHPKAYLFSNSSTHEGVAFVGSSNLSRSALQHGVEWNIETRHVGGLLAEFERLWGDPRSVRLDRAWLDRYAVHRSNMQMASTATGESSVVGERPEAPPSPNEVQRVALDALEDTRSAGFAAGLVVMATGLGKTWLAAFDSTRPSFRRTLFVAHREEILRQARDVFRRIRPVGRLSFFAGEHRDSGGDVVFASVQSLARNLEQFDPESFDYVVVDEFHHADAPTYRRVIGHFRPAFLLGLTATPERTDQADLLALCADNLVYDCGLVEGIQRGLLSPFAYRAIRDVADYEHIPWRSGRFDAAELTTALATEARAYQVLEEWSRLDQPAQRRALGFCCTIEHADYMAGWFTSHGVHAAAVHSGVTSAPRGESLDQLEAGTLQILFAVDLFNEGLDVPSIDTVLMLRPTESPVVFLQQLGRGLRRHDGKTHLDVIDLVGNHRSFLVKARMLAELAGRPGQRTKDAIDWLRDTGDRDLPPGCSMVIDTEVIDLFEHLARRTSTRDRQREWILTMADEQGGRRPTALEFALRTGGKVPGSKQSGGWFAELLAMSLLDADEVAVFHALGDFLAEIEFGNYSRSWKLVTVQALLNASALRSGMGLAELAIASRWLVLRDRRLRDDLFDARHDIADPSNPTEAEWISYWRKNPVNAWIGGNTDSEDAWFRLDGDRFMPRFDVPSSLVSTFEAMLSEVVEYRLHRYLERRRRLDTGERRRPHDGTSFLDATFVVETLDGRPTIVIESAGGTRGTMNARNTDYVQGLDLVLERLAQSRVVLVDAYVDSTTTAALQIAERRLDVGGPLPVSLAETDLPALRRRVIQSMAQIGRAPGAQSGGGNQRKRIRLVLDVVGMTDAQLADRLASPGGPERTDEVPGSA